MFFTVIIHMIVFNTNPPLLLSFYVVTFKSFEFSDAIEREHVLNFLSSYKCRHEITVD